jgi:hypothetical protein
MKTKQFIPVLILLGLAGVAAIAANSINYTIDPAVIDQGGGHASTSTFPSMGSIGGSVIGAGTSTNYVLETDYPYTVLDTSSGPPPVPPLLILPGAQNPGPSNESNNAPDVVLLQLRLQAGPSGANVDSLVLTASGSGNDAPVGGGGDIVQVSLYEDMNNNGLYESAVDSQIGSAQFFSGDDGTATFGALAHNIPGSTAQNWIVVYDFQVAGATLKTFICSIASPTDVTATDGSSGNPIGVNGPPLTSAAKTFNPGVGATGTLTVMAGPHNISRDIYAGTQETAMQVQLAASSFEDITVSGLTFHTQGTADESNDVLNVYLYDDLDGNGTVGVSDVMIAGPDQFLFDNGQRAYIFNAVVSAGQSATWILVYDLADPLVLGETFNAYILDSTSVTAQGLSSLSPVTATLTPSSPIGGAILTVNENPTLAAGPSYFMGGCAGGGSDLPGVFGLALLVAAFAGLLLTVRLARQN